MTIAFPRDMPGRLAIRGCEFNLSYSQSRAPTRGGLVQVVNIAPDLWEMSFETPPMLMAEAMTWHAWRDSLRGGARLFKGFHPLLEFAQAYRTTGYAALTRHGGGAFDGTSTLSSIGAARDTVTLTTLPTQFIFTIGDMVSVPFGADGRSLHRVMEGVTASAGSATLTVEPTVPLAAVTGVTATLHKPWCKAVIDAGSFSGPWQTGRLSPVRFRAMQVY